MYEPTELPQDPITTAYNSQQSEPPEEETPHKKLVRLLMNLRERLIALDNMNVGKDDTKILSAINDIKDIFSQFDNHITFEMLIDAGLKHGHKDLEILELQFHVEDLNEWIDHLEAELEYHRARKPEDEVYNWKHLAAGGVIGSCFYATFLQIIDALNGEFPYSGDPNTDIIRGLLGGAAGTGLFGAFHKAQLTPPSSTAIRLPGEQYIKYGSYGCLGGIAMAILEKTL